jgi:hypothetical protein
MIDQYRARISGDVGDAVSLGQQPLAYAELGAGVGGMLSEPAMLGSKYLSGAALTNTNMMMGRYGNMGNALKSFSAYKQRQDNIARAGGNQGMTAAAGRTVDRHYARNMI